MPNNCGACGSHIIDYYMECANDKCMKRYDIICLEINEDAFKTYTQSYKNKWLCPECISAKPKRGNSETPVRINIPNFNATTPVNNVCTQRGSQTQYSPITMDSDSLLLEELREFKADVLARMDSQANAISLLLNQFSQTKTELGKIIKMMTVLEEKVEAKLTQNNQIHEIAADIPQNSPSTSSFAEVVRRQNNSNVSEKTLHTYIKTQKVNKCGATKSNEILPEKKNV